MKRAFLMILALCLLAAMAGCGDGAQTENPAQTATPAPGTSSSSTPNYAAADFSGHWAVSEVYDTKGTQVTGSAFDALDTGFMLELLADGKYFVYDPEGTVLGQGTYAVSGDVLTLTAGSAQTVYTITDENTLRATAADGSVTVMARQPEEAPEEVAEPDDETDIEDEDLPEVTGEETDIPDEAAELVETATSEPDATATATTGEQ